MTDAAPPVAPSYSYRKLDGHGYGVFGPDGTEAAWATTKAEAEHRTTFLNTPPEQRPRYEVWQGTSAEGVGPLPWDVLRAWDGKRSDGTVIYRGIVSQEAAERRAAALNAGEPEPHSRANRRGPNVYLADAELWDVGLRFTSLDDVKAYVTRLYTSAWFIRHYGSKSIPEVRKQRGQGGHASYEGIRIGFNGGYARQLVVLHEVAHQAAGVEHWHDKRFSRVFLEIVRHEMGETVGKRMRDLYKQHGVRMDSPTKPRLTTVAAKAHAERRAPLRETPKVWRFQVTRNGVQEVAAFQAKTMGGAMLQAERKWHLDDGTVTSLKVWKGRASPARKPARKAAARGRPK